MKKNKDKVTLEQTLTLFKNIDKNRPFERQIIDVSKSQQTPKKIDWKEKRIHQHPNFLQGIKQVNKNRAIKNIIESSQDVLIKNYRPKVSSDFEVGKSAETQLNIYMKQYNRLMGQMLKKQSEINQQITIKAEQKQDILQEIYQFNVIEDFRQVLNVAFCKDKISKTNINMMIDSFQPSLVVLKTNEIKIYQGAQFRLIKMDEIQNVDYHTQPYIFIVLTVTKDKSKTSDYVYLKFDSIGNQQKWDHALYANYVCRKMKKKQRMFELQYVIEQQNKQTKQEIKNKIKRDDDKLQYTKVLDRIMKSQQQLESPKEVEVEELSAPNYFQYLKASMNKEISNLKEGDKEGKQINKEESQNISSPSHQIKRKNRKQSLFYAENERLIQTPPKSPFKMNFKQESQKHLNLFLGTEQLKQKSDGKKKQLILENSEILPNKQQENRKAQIHKKQKRIHELEQKNISGFIMTKQNFFFNKSKKVFLKNMQINRNKKNENQESTVHEGAMKQRNIKQKQKCLEYWDFNLSSGEKTEKKIIEVREISKVDLNENQKLVICYGKKQLVLSGEGVKQIMEWIDLCRSFKEQENERIKEISKNIENNDESKNEKNDVKNDKNVVNNVKSEVNYKNEEGNSPKRQEMTKIVQQSQRNPNKQQERSKLKKPTNSKMEVKQNIFDQKY